MRNYIMPALLAVCAVFAPVQSILVATLALVGTDLVTGVLAAWKRGEAIRSAGLRRTVGKLLVYEVAICVGWVAERYLMGAAVPATKLIAGLIGAVELKSCLENLDSLGGGGVLRSVILRVAPRNPSKGGE